MNRLKGDQIISGGISAGRSEICVLMNAWVVPMCVTGYVILGWLLSLVLPRVSSLLSSSAGQAGEGEAEAATAVSEGSRRGPQGNACPEENH